jgi:hAT family C-terminal dimerisation region
VPGDEYDAYLASPPTRVDDPIIWWRDHQTIYAKLAQMAFDLLSVPAMSAECERVFSQAKLTVKHQRNRLLDTAIDAIQCMKNWLRNKAYSLMQ